MGRLNQHYEGHRHVGARMPFIGSFSGCFGIAYLQKCYSILLAMLSYFAIAAGVTFTATSNVFESSLKRAF